VPHAAAFEARLQEKEMQIAELRAAELSAHLQRWARRDKQLQSGVSCLLGIDGEIGV
jgi:hypothetical protein